MELTKKTLKKIDASHAVKGMLADIFKRSPKTIQRWVDKNDVMLTNAAALKVYKEEFGIEQSEAIIDKLVSQ